MKGMPFTDGDTDVSIAGFTAAAWLSAAWPSLLAAAPERADPTPRPRTEAWNVHAQSTYVWQVKPAFPAAYSGPNSLLPSARPAIRSAPPPRFGLRAWDGGELYFDPEVVQGKAFSGLHGLGGTANGELQKTSGTSPTFYRARLFLRQTWNLGGEAVRPSSPT